MCFYLTSACQAQLQFGDIDYCYHASHQKLNQDIIVSGEKMRFKSRKEKIRKKTPRETNLRKDLEWLTIGPSDEIFPPSGCQTFWHFTFKLFFTKCDVRGFKAIKIYIFNLIRIYVAHTWQFLSPWHGWECSEYVPQSNLTWDLCLNLINSANNLCKPLLTHT